MGCRAVVFPPIQPSINAAAAKRCQSHGEPPDSVNTLVRSLFALTDSPATDPVAFNQSSSVCLRVLDARRGHCLTIFTTLL